MAESPFRINSLKMRDAERGEVLWESGPMVLGQKEIEAHIPAKLLQCKAVAREIQFSSDTALKKLSCTQQVYLQDQPVEEWDFQFGFVMPGSTNSWEQTLQADPGSMFTPEDLSGKLLVVTEFKSQNEVVASSRVRIFYDK